MADKSSIRNGKKRIVADVLDTLGDAVALYFNSEDKDDKDYAASTLNICKNLLNNINF